MMLALAAVLAVAAAGLYIAALWETGVAEDCERFGGGREGGSLRFERSYWPPEGECSYVGPAGNERSVARGWPWAAAESIALLGSERRGGPVRKSSKPRWMGTK